MEPARSVQKGSAKKKFPRRSNRYGVDFKLQVVKKFLEESVPVSIIGQECGLSKGTVGRWVREYRREGEAGLKTIRTGKGRSLPSPVKKKITEIKEANPLFGIKRISQLLKRAFFLSASPETVRKTLHQSSLMSAPPKKRQRNMTRPRFFERSVPNQLWQTDIFTFRLGGHYAYLIGYIDDYSRYITGLGFLGARRRRTSLRCTAGRPPSTTHLKRCSRTMAGSTRAGGATAGLKES